MITATCTHYHNCYRLEISRPDRNTVEFKMVNSAGEAERYLYLKNREYIIEKLAGWLRQRRRGLEEFNLMNRAVKAAQLEVLLNCYKNASLAAVCRIVNDHAEALELLAPGDRSAHYKHYHTIIEPIIHYCKENGGN